MINTYLLTVYEEATKRGYNFKREKIGSRISDHKMAVTDGQLHYEFNHLKKKLMQRNKMKYDEIVNISKPEPHPIFHVVSGELEPWERALPSESEQE